VPFAFDLVGRSGGVASAEPPGVLNSHAGLRYLYQKLGVGGPEEWSTVDAVSIPRHFVRTASQAELTRRSIPWLPIGSDSVTHDEAVAKTEAAIRAQLSSSISGLERKAGSGS
jgi:hypothetical protein